MILSLLLVSMISKSWAYSFTNGFCKYEVISEDEQTVRLIGFHWCDYVPGTDINLSQFVTDESANMTYELKEIKINSNSCVEPTTITTIGTLYIPVSVEKIDGILTCESSSIIVAEGNPVYDSRNNCNAIIETATNKLVYGCNNTVIPSSVTSIGDEAFYYCSDLTGISIPSSVTSIGSGAFWGCSGLTTITVDADNPVYDSRNNCNAIIETATNKLISGCKNTVIPSSVTRIGTYAFIGCSSLTSISIPSSVTSIGDFAFTGCSGLTGISIPSSVTSIGGNAFSGCSGLTSISIPSSVTSIGNSVFYGCSGLTGISIPSSVTSIGNFAFSDCSGLTGISIPSSVTSIGDHAFDDCSGLTTITVDADNPVYDSRNNCNAIIETATNELISGCKNTVIPSSVTSIGNYAFSDCSGLTSISIPSSVTSIGNSVFYGCSGLTGISIPSSVTSIGDHAFCDCSGLTSISIPSSVTSIGSWAFGGCSSLTTITVDVDNPVYDSRNNCNAIIETATNKLISGCKNTVIPSSVTSIGSSAFGGCSSLNSISIPSSVTSIGSSAFFLCSGLTSISIPSSVTSIGSWAFAYCSSLTSVTCKSSTPPSLGEYRVFETTPTSTLYVPVGSRSAYSSTSGWNVFDNIVEVGPDHVVSTTDVKLVKDGQTWLAVSLENKKDILGFQFDLTLPSGIVVNTDADGNLVSKLGDRCSDFKQTFTYIGDSKYRVTCLSMEGAAVTGHDGELMRICLTSDREVEPGDYDIVLSNIQLTTTEGTATVTIYPEDYNSKLTLLNYALGDVDGNGSITVTDAVMVVQHILYKTPSNFILETADVNTDGIINVGDVVSILDLISSTSNSKSVSLKALEAE